MDDNENSWFSKALQTTLTTELNKIDQLDVVSLEKIQREAEREDLDRMAAARRLGVQRFVAGSFAVYGDEMRIDAWIVETAMTQRSRSVGNPRCRHRSRI